MNTAFHKTDISFHGKLSTRNNGLEMEKMQYRFGKWSAEVEIVVCVFIIKFCSSKKKCIKVIIARNEKYYEWKYF